MFGSPLIFTAAAYYKRPGCKYFNSPFTIKEEAPMNCLSARKAWMLIRVIVLYATVVASVSAQSAAPLKAYPNVKITNLTGSIASGEVNYAACRNDKFSGLQPGDTWRGPGRGLCLITWVSVKLMNGARVNNYTSSGTSYSEFFVTPNGPGFQVFSTHEDPTQNRALPPLLDKPVFNIAHMVNSRDALDWAFTQGVNALEMDLHFHSNGTPAEFRHGGICDCVCASFEGGDHVCRHSVGVCEARAQLQAHLNQIATKSSQIAMIIIDGKVDSDNLSTAAQQAAGAAVVEMLEQHLFSKGYIGIAVIAAPKWQYNAYLKAAVARANSSPYKGQLYFSVDMDNGGTDGARATLDHLWHDLGTPNVVYGSGVSACVAGSFYAETMLAGFYEAVGRIRLVNIWTLDKTDSMQRYLWLGSRGPITNIPKRFPQSATARLAKPGYRP